MAKQSDVELAIAMRAEVTDLSSVEHEGVRYYALPRRGLNRYDTSDSAADHVFSCFRPDLLHVEGTEMAYARRLLSRWSGPKVVSLQGVINGYRPYQFGRIESGEWVDCKSPGLLFTGLALWVNDRFRFRPRLAGERQTLAMASDILGRTLWDRAQASWLAPQANYHHCPRILREPFYQYKWTAERCEPFSIFVGNGASALKGAHFAVRALPLLQRHFPKVKLYIAGRDPFRLSRLSAQRAIGYSRYLTTLIRSQGVEAAVSFTGQLDAQAMADRMR
ncbi:MAG: glycosyltransferase family 4 protein [Opitutales bacterium]|nr:glycosyltransferase family 4 protein [Opitutales bacterium]